MCSHVVHGRACEILSCCIWFLLWNRTFVHGFDVSTCFLNKSYPQARNKHRNVHGSQRLPEVKCRRRLNDGPSPRGDLSLHEMEAFLMTSCNVEKLPDAKLFMMLGHKSARDLIHDGQVRAGRSYVSDASLYVDCRLSVSVQRDLFSQSVFPTKCFFVMLCSMRRIATRGVLKFGLHVLSNRDTCLVASYDS